ncbi:nuclear transport factor 2 family protein [Persicitalea jodogahamensis]|uniref:SnoaL-like domain-containing protein n=1 Tax=Persicitalea jodogahamensis TaxID=402147 RepID=A0A8J3D0G7_9BACT|nr:nuclear transport factor 2 family protein [Persicitalea jodogahamensis]GHB57614.1 hypothetical protein GCM10007390_08790 [Persicitalea jodogahamensis]
MLTQESIEKLAKDWYRKLDVHAPMVEVLPMLIDDGLEMVFPEATVYGYAGFEGWFQRVIRIFFDEVHTVKTVEPVIDGDTATVRVVVKWEASVWNAPDAESKRITLDAFQTWEVKAGPNDTVLITKYTVDGLEYYEGSAEL